MMFRQLDYFRLVVRSLCLITLVTLQIGLGFTNVEAQPFAYVPNQGSNNVSVIDTSTNTEVLPRIPVGSQPLGVALTPDGAFAYVTNSSSYDVSVIDTSTNTEVLPRIPVGFYPYGVAFTPDGAYAYVVNIAPDASGNPAPSNVSVIDTSTNTEVLPRIPVGTSPFTVAITPDGAFAYVVNFWSHDVSVIDTSTNTEVLPRIPVGNNPIVVAITPDGAFAYVTNYNSHDISVIDTSTNTEVLPRIPVGSNPYGVAFTPDGAFAYVVNQGSNNVSVIDTSTNTEVLPRIPVGNNPVALAFTPDGAFAYVANYNSHDVSVIDTSTNTEVLPRISVGTNPRGVAITSLLQSQTITVTQSAPASGIFGTSFNVAATGGGSGNPVVIAASGACAGGGNNSAFLTMTSGTGTCMVTFDQAGNARYDPAPTVTQTTTAQKATPTISINNIPGSAVNGGNFTPTFTYIGDGSILVTSSTMSRCTVSGGVVNFVGGGTCTLTASATTTANVTAATGSPQSFTISPAPATISINNVPSSAAYGGSFKPTYAYIGNGKTSATSITPSICTVANNGVVSFIGVGTCTLTANATATADYLAATGTPQSFAIGQATTTISIKNIPNSAKKGSSFTLTYNYNGDGATSVTSSTASTCTVSGASVNFVNTGTCTLTAHAMATVRYKAADGSPQSFTIK